MSPMSYPTPISTCTTKEKKGLLIAHGLGECHRSDRCDPSVIPCIIATNSTM